MSSFGVLLLLIGVALALATTARIVSSQFLQNEIQTLLAADVATLASATAMKIHLASNNFTPSAALTLGGLTEATFTGYAALLAGTGTQTTYIDPITGLLTIEIKAPAGGWQFKCTGATGLPQTIFGFYLTDNGTVNLYGSALLTTPITISAINQGFDLGAVTLKFVATSPF